MSWLCLVGVGLVCEYLGVYLVCLFFLGLKVDVLLVWLVVILLGWLGMVLLLLSLFGFVVLFELCVGILMLGFFRELFFDSGLLFLVMVCFLLFCYCVKGWGGCCGGCVFFYWLVF